MKFYTGLKFQVGFIYWFTLHVRFIPMKIIFKSERVIDLCSADDRPFRVDICHSSLFSYMSAAFSFFFYFIKNMI